MPPGATTIRPGTVDVCVLDPVPTVRWKAKDIARHVDRIRSDMQKTLERWPAHGDD